MLNNTFLYATLYATFTLAVGTSLYSMDSSSSIKYATPRRPEDMKNTFMLSHRNSERLVEYDPVHSTVKDLRALISSAEPIKIIAAGVVYSDDTLLDLLVKRASGKIYAQVPLNEQ